MTGIKKSGISSYENDLYDPSAKALISLSNVFNVSIDWLLSGKNHYYNLDTDFWVEYNSLSDNDKKELRLFINYLKYKNEIWR
ncbi:helix-turn-helix domain-containing protein [Tissierella carlieri]|uniref:helix-turn-helix domain-containing protein n=1 Tax=Tissierella carlieri TaxID=689904 RepID=UPI003B84806D